MYFSQLKFDTFERSCSSILFAKLAIFTIVTIKLLSRDFSLISIIPAEYFVYPLEYRELYNNHYLTLAFLVDLTSGHFIHWVIPYPSPFMFDLLKCCFVIFLALPTLGISKRVDLLGVFVSTLLFNYFYTFPIKLGQDIDGNMLYGLLIISMAFTSRDASVVNLFRSDFYKPSKEGSDSIIILLLAFSAYYFLCGINKVIDINLREWIDFDVANVINYTIEIHKTGELEKPFAIPFFEVFSEHFGTLANFVIPIGYLSHLGTPLVLFNSRLLLPLVGFYILFHFIVSGFGIFFFGYMIIWLILILEPWAVLRFFNEKK